MTGERRSDAGGALAYRPFVPVIATAAALSAVLGDPGSSIDNAVVLVAVVPFFVWLRRPSFPSLGIVATTAVAVFWATRNSELEASMFVLSMAATVLGGYERSTARFVIGGVVLASVPLLGLVLVDNDTAAGVWMMGVLLPLALSRVQRRQLATAQELAAARSALADHRVLEERRRIARDVHDSVGHGLAAVLLQITGARHVLRRDPDAADEALAEAERVGRRSMRELRDTLGLLRTEAGAGPAAPVPVFDDVAHDEVWRRFTISGDVSRIDALAATSLHRVAEEALANAGRHAPDSRTDATLVVRDGAVVMTIESFGPAVVCPTDADRRPRYGIVGMSERVAAVGGTIDVGPTPSGWVVRAAVPLGDARAGS